MKRTPNRRIASAVIPMLLLAIIVQAGPGDVVHIPDPNLRQAVKVTLRITNDPTETDMLGLRTLYCRSSGVITLTGLEYAVNLTRLYLYDNQISDISPLSGTTTLETLDLNWNQISDISPLSGLKQITDLVLQMNRIGDISPLSSLTRLTSLNLSYNQISDISALSGLTHLTKLNVSANQIVGISVLSGHTNLTNLILYSNRIADISVLAGLTNLTELEVGNNPISDISILSGLTNVTDLNLWRTGLRDISVLSGLTGLTGLVLAGNQISDISALSGMTHLTTLWLQGNPLNQEACSVYIPMIAANNPGIDLLYDSTYCQSPVITQHPQTQTVCPGGTATFTVSAIGVVPLGYQWRKNGSNIAGAIGSSYTISMAVNADAGSYDCVVANASGTATSNAATLVVSAAPSITQQPQSQTVCAGSSVTFTVSATGGAPLNYQWRTNGSNIAGATGSSYAISAVGSVHGASYDCVVTNACGTATSNAATLVVSAAPSITQQPQSQTVYAGSPVAFTVGVAGTGPVSYQWRKGGSNIAGATGSSYTINAVSTADGGSYDCVVTNACGTVTSNTAVLIVVSNTPAVTRQPQSQAVCAGSSVTFRVSATGMGPLSYQWRKNGSDIPGATGSSYAISAVGSPDAGSYDCVVTNASGTATSNAATLTVGIAPAMAQQPQSQAVCIGSSVGFTVAATGTGPLGYQWRKDGSNIAGATGSSYMVSAVGSADAGSYDCVVTNACGTATSNVATLIVADGAPVMAQQPQSQAVCAGSPVTFTVATTGTGSVSYQWRKGGSKIAGATGSSYTITAVGSADAGSYDCVVTNACGTATSSAATLTVNIAPTITQQPQSQTVCAGSSVTFAVAATGTAPLGYQWRRGGSNIAGATESSYTITSAGSADAGSYDCVVTNTCAATSNAATLTVNTSPAITQQPGTQTVCSGSSVRFTVAATGTAPLGYQWRKGGSNIAGATGSSYTITAAGSADAGSYDCVVTNACGTVTSTAAILTVNTPDVTPGGGTGTFEDPYLVYTAQHINSIGLSPCLWGQHFRLMADIDLAEFDGKGGRAAFNIIASDNDPTKDGFQGTPFTGVFAGNGHTISHLVTTGKDYVGLFGQLGAGAEVKDLGLADANTVGSGAYVGGLVGYNDRGTVTRCYSTGTVSGGSYVGGLVGNNSGTMTACYSMVAVNGTGQSVGGLVGRSGGTVLYCYSAGWVVGRTDAGGLVGSNSGSVAGCFWNTQTSGQSRSAGGYGKTTAELQQVATFGGWGADGAWTIDEGAGYPRLVWEHVTGQVITTLFYGGGTGTAGDPYLIYAAEQMNTIGANPSDWGRQFRLMADIDLSGIDGKEGRPVFNMIAPDTDPVKSGFQGTVFTGVFDGNGHLISHLTITGEDYVGLFGQLGSGAEVRALGVVDNETDSSGRYVGGLVGYNAGTVTQCYSTGAVSGGQDVGGLVGYNAGTVSQCYCTGAATGSSNTGGLVGFNSAALICCYSIGAVAGTGNSRGGLVGSNGGAHGGTTTRCFWDTQTSGQAATWVGMGKPTVEMQTAETFLKAGWDLVGEVENGTSEIWGMPDGGGYPVLAIFSGYTPPQLQGRGTPEDPYLIHDALELGAAVHRSPSAHYRLAASIDLTGIRWSVPVIPRFAGTFDGNSFTVSHLTIQGGGRPGGYLGLFGHLASGAEVKNLAVLDVNTASSGSYDYAGGLVGRNDGTVTRCHSIGGISGSGSFGGLVGQNSGTVAQCYSTAAVSGRGLVGGLVGYNAGTVTRCSNAGTVIGGSPVGGLVGSNGAKGTVTQSYSTGTVMGRDRVGGLVGDNSAPVTSCYSTGMIFDTGQDVQRVGGLVGSGSGVVARCFWSISTSGQSTSAGGTGMKGTAGMQRASTFLNAGWDFAGETANGTEDIWWIDEGQDYPRLVWELPRPQDGVAEVSPLSILRWVPRVNAWQYDVYLGQDREGVAGATVESVGVFRGRQSWEQTTYDAGIFEWDETYFWRIDPVGGTDPNGPARGNVWSFTTANFIVVDDFEGYTDNYLAGETVFDVWIGGGGSSIGSADFPSTEQRVVHSGGQSMPMDYSNVIKPWLSEAARTWETPQDWTVGGADTLTLYLRGRAANGRDGMYVAIEDSAARVAVISDPDPNTVLVTQWQRWQVPLVDLQAAGVDATAVKKLIIGVGDRDSPKPGGTGRIYIDDIRLTKRMP